MELGKFITGFLVVMGIGGYRNLLAKASNADTWSSTSCCTGALRFDSGPGNGNEYHRRTADLRNHHQLHYVLSRAGGVLTMSLSRRQLFDLTLARYAHNKTQQFDIVLAEKHDPLPHRRAGCKCHYVRHQKADPCGLAIRSTIFAAQAFLLLLCLSVLVQRQVSLRWRICLSTLPELLGCQVDIRSRCIERCLTMDKCICSHPPGAFALTPHCLNCGRQQTSHRHQADLLDSLGVMQLGTSSSFHANLVETLLQVAASSQHSHSKLFFLNSSFVPCNDKTLQLALAPAIDRARNASQPKNQITRPEGLHGLAAPFLRSPAQSAK